jgi:hypothetical protein
MHTWKLGMLPFRRGWMDGGNGTGQSLRKLSLGCEQWLQERMIGLLVYRSQLNMGISWGLRSNKRISASSLELMKMKPNVQECPQWVRAHGDSPTVETDDCDVHAYS